MSQNTLPEYAQDLVADVLATAEAENATAPDTFTRRVLDELEQAGEIENTFTAYHRAHGLEVNGYGNNESLGTLDLFITHFSLKPDEDRLPRAHVETLFKRLTTFVRRCRDGLARDIDESSDVHDMCIAVEKALPDAPRIRLFLLTDVVSAVSALPPGELDGLTVTHEVWDLNRLHRLASSGTLSEPIVVDFDPPLPCLATPETDRNYSVFLAIIPGQELADLYGKHGTRLLELNVRSFLQTKGGVNRGIRDTLLHNPDRFLAYNNGITATASTVEFTQLPGGGQAISRVHDLQIVNGGQTTASIHYAHTRDKADLSRAYVQMKLTRVSEDRLQEIVPEISKYSNTQNKVTVVDFSSNHPFHVGIEKVTRSLWAPAADGSGQETRWFYERARGQYTDALARERTPANQRRFKSLHPLAQKFTKADAAKYIHSWAGLPYLVSRGAEKNFRELMMRMGDDVPEVNVSFGQRLIAKAILFKATDKVVAARDFGGYKINIVSYSIARIAEATNRRIDLDQIWREQRLTPALTAALEELCVPVREVIVNPLRGGTNIGEWAKRPDCWEAILGIPWTVPDDLAAELADHPLEDSAPTVSEDSAAGDIASVMAVPAPEWFAMARWAKETRNLQPWQRQLADTVGRYVNNSWPITEKQATQALRAMEEARRLGFHANS
ncbi:AIPR family protein [Plantactinospora sp. KBS50]|uniref:AIPR family protein n=1 Tax=Plantactinospora sp. KBS50 TaxID=2024580 RepID=UPI000BAAB116|nr:AIPR family protein [Plantactinospora sp. KBS50]ASW54749.1 abortive phage resistance protein [Plantactinospora sp. KBS50]